MSEKRALWIIFLGWFLGFLISGGCSAPKATYQLETRCNDIWVEKPTQSVSFKIDIRR